MKLHKFDKVMFRLFVDVLPFILKCSYYPNFTFLVRRKGGRIDVFKIYFKNCRLFKLIFVLR